MTQVFLILNKIIFLIEINLRTQEILNFGMFSLYHCVVLGLNILLIKE